MKKTIVLTSLKLQDCYLLPKIIEKELSELILIQNYETSIIHPLGCSIRSIIQAIVYEEVESIYIVGNTINPSFKNISITNILYNKGISKEVIDTFNYVNILNMEVEEWLTTAIDIRQGIAENMKLIKNHPLIAPSVKVTGIVFNSETKVWKKVEECVNDGK
ncbi:hypothetical protein ACWE42_19580 [Sutcliffiella cohnii]|uniref:carbonic anhydrase n=1 Tax=Sutcliffiella cohnii TaxID=33932 RepID=A0A223KQJ4_9BACI|nr:MULTISPECIES: hypothetical protein [Sutcliffiella]AST91624.1 hypothetical protein BC6307_10190 [Sutcliffiella cohnii]MED4014792.1 hypothetical protein [Sutcliffiella cohnii]WBL12840.1 hypothetical protein O1A01_12850 [Sutcliffiella sp. NC1]